MTSKLTKKRIEELFSRLNDRLEKEGIKGEIYLVGGAVMCLTLNARASTRDLDALFVPVQRMRKIIHDMAIEEDLPEDWINDGVKGFFSQHGSFEVYVEKTHLLVYTAKPEYLLAMKCLSLRIGEEFADQKDIQYLVRYLNIETLDRAIETITQYYPKQKFPQKTFYFLEELLKK